MFKREVRRTKEKYGRLFEPFQVFLLMLIFTIPIIAIVNLSPQTGTTTPPQDNVLGITTESKPDVAEVGGSHEFITNERLTTDDDIVYLYQATVLRRDPGVYSKPIIMITNPSSEVIIARFMLKEFEPSSTQIGIMADSTNYIIKESGGESFIREFELDPGDEMIFYLDVRNNEKVNFEENIDVRIDTRFKDGNLFFEVDEEFEGEILLENGEEASEPLEEEILEEDVEIEEPEEALEDEPVDESTDEAVDEEEPPEEEETDAIVEIIE